MQRIALGILSLFLLAFASPAQEKKAAPGPAKLLDRVAVMGASVSAGFGLSKELEVATPLAKLFDAALIDPPTETQNLADNLFFLGPFYKGKELTDRAIKSDPTLVVAVDFLFWYGMYYRHQKPADRMAGLERGLKQLERLDCPVVVGDFPDIRRALKGKHEVTGRPVVFPSMIPAEETRAAMNTRVHAWAAKRKNVVLVPLSTFLDDLATGKPLVLPQDQAFAGKVEEILQVDLLHPKLRGTQALVLTILDKVAQSGLAIDRENIRWSMDDMAKKLWQLTEDKREKARASALRRKRLIENR